MFVASRSKRKKKRRKTAIVPKLKEMSERDEEADDEGGRGEGKVKGRRGEERRRET